jgi:4-hydroxybutyryl-CoA dehydratase/vinylacetyl-CoA-Delta-isomerase
LEAIIEEPLPLTVSQVNLTCNLTRNLSAASSAADGLLRKLAQSKGSTTKAYKESLRKQNPKVYMEGEEVKNIVDHPGFQVAINNTGVSYELEHDPKYRDVATLTSPLINEEIRRWTNIQQNEQDALAMVRLMGGMGDYFCPCCYRCLTSIALNSAWAVSYGIDQKYNTDYHQRVVEFVKEAQRNDWIIGAASIDPKGDRSLKLSEQQDPDLHLHVIEKKKDGIVVRGAKAHVSCGPYAHMLSVRGSGKAEASEKDYALGFLPPVDAEGLIHISKPAPAPREPKDFENPIRMKHGGL